jgi:hypothetical protein
MYSPERLRIEFPNTFDQGEYLGSDFSGSAVATGDPDNIFVFGIALAEVSPILAAILYTAFFDFPIPSFFGPRITEIAWR